MRALADSPPLPSDARSVCWRTRWSRSCSERWHRRSGNWSRSPIAPSTSCDARASATSSRAASELALPALLALDRLRSEGLPNWPSPFAMHIAVLAERDGLPVAWVPGPELLTKWALAPDLAARMDLLLEHADQVVVDCEAALDDVIDPDLRGARDLLRQAVDCVRTAPAPAQALALTAAVTLSADLVGTGRHLYRLTSALAPLTRPLYLSEIGQLRSTLTLLAVRPVLDRFDPDKGDPVPTRANRHAVAHALDPGQYTLPNALLSVLVAVSVLRQTQADRDLVRLLDASTVSTSPTSPTSPGPDA